MGSFWRQDRKLLSPHGSRPDSKDRGDRQDLEKLIIAICFGLLGAFQTMIACAEIKEKPAQDRKTHLETVSLPVTEILSPVARQALRQLST